MATMSREKVLERKIVTLEQRLVLVERFVEMRFCETFRDFSTRNVTGKSVVNPLTSTKSYLSKKRSKNETDKQTRHYDDVETQGPASPAYSIDDDNQDEPTYRTRSGRKSTRPTLTGSTSSKEMEKKVLRVTVSRLESTNKKTIGESSGPSSPTTVVKECPDSDDGSDFQVCDDDYFTYPNTQIDNSVCPGENEKRDSTADYDNDSVGSDKRVDEDPDWSEPQDFQGKRPPKAKSKKNIKKIRGKNIVDEETRNSRRRYYKRASVKLIPKGVRLEKIKSDGDKECPVCHAHYKVENFDRHLRTHTKERHLKCSHCDKTFFLTKNLQAHEKRHVEGLEGLAETDGFHNCRICGMVCHNKRMLRHERRCVKLTLERGKPVDSRVMVDIRQRSLKIDLNWPDPNEKIPEGMKKCSHCKELIETDFYIGHLKEKHANWKCTLCPKTFVGKNGLVRHLCHFHAGENQRVHGRKKAESEDSDSVDYDDDEEDEEERVETDPKDSRDKAGIEDPLENVKHCQGGVTDEMMEIEPN